jgi:hypothetical protein
MVREEMRVEAGGGVLAANPEHSATLRRLGRGGLSIEERERGPGGDGGAPELDQISTVDGGRGYGRVHRVPLVT